MVIQKRHSSQRKSRQVIRDLASQVAEAASEPEQREKAELWTKKNGLERVRPLVLIFPEGSWEEIMADWQWETEDDFYRPLEMDLRMRLYYRQHLEDDNFIEPVVFSPVEYHSTGYGLDAARIESSLHKGSYRIEPVIKTEADIEKIKPPHITVDWEATGRSYAR